MPKLRKPFTRIKSPKNIVPTKSTTKLLIGIHYHEGILSQNQIIKGFFPGKTISWPEARLQQYFDHYLVNKFNAEWVHGEHLGETVYTLGTRGARLVARKLDIDFTSLSWRRKPRWHTLKHDLRLNDFRLTVTKEARALEGFELIQWMSETELHQIHIIPGRPDGFLLLKRNSPEVTGRVEELAILPEVDNATHPLDRFVQKKVKPALKFIGSEKYKDIFGVKSGAIFVVTTGIRRLTHLKKEVEKAGGSGRFYFTTYDQIKTGVLTNPIWQMAGSNEKLSIATMPLKPRLRAKYTTQARLFAPLGA